MSDIHRACVAAILLAVLLSSGCAWSVGGTQEDHREKPTIGEELIALKDARDQDAISEEEYAKVKQALMDAASNR